jgi:hypothetical protein
MIMQPPINNGQLFIAWILSQMQWIFLHWNDLTYLLTYSWSWAAYSAATQEFPSILWNSKLLMDMSDFDIKLG